jgi:uncharacterized protein YeaO (DUF488 family)
METEVLTKRVYEPMDDSDGLRILIDRLWPRGIKKENLKCDIWAKELAPSTELRKMLHADVENNWAAFEKDYLHELETSSVFADLISRIKKEKPQHVTLLYAFKNKTKNNAVILQKEIIKALKDDI